MSTEHIFYINTEDKVLRKGRNGMYIPVLNRLAVTKSYQLSPEGFPSIHFPRQLWIKLNETDFFFLNFKKTFGWTTVSWTIASRIYFPLCILIFENNECKNYWEEKVCNWPPRETMQNPFKIPTRSRREVDSDTVWNLPKLSPLEF